VAGGLGFAVAPPAVPAARADLAKAMAMTGNPSPSPVPDPGGGEHGPRNSQRRQAVLDAAAAAFARQGYHGASTRSIADELGLKVASLYFHIASKEEALGEICLTGSRRNCSYLNKAMEEPGDLAAVIRRYFRIQLQDFMINADYVGTYAREARHLSPAAREKISEVNREYIRTLDNLFEHARRRGELAEGLDPRQARFVMIGAVRAFGMLFAEGRLDTSDTVVAGWLEVLVRGMVRNYTPPKPAPGDRPLNKPECPEIAE
jgi:AcrR family transcriptional regulator